MNSEYMQTCPDKPENADCLPSQSVDEEMFRRFVARRRLEQYWEERKLKELLYDVLEEWDREF